MENPCRGAFFAVPPRCMPFTARPSSQPPPPPKRRVSLAAREQFREELVDIARRIFLSEGYAAVTIRRITAEAGVTPMAFYWYFDCKDALLIVIWDEIILEVARAAQAQSEAAPESERVLAYCEGMLDFWLAHADYFRFIFLGETPNVDMMHLRKQLRDLPGTRKVYRDVDALLMAAAHPARQTEAECHRMRALLIYRLFGFLHSFIGTHSPEPELLALQRRWVREDLMDALGCWRQSPPPPSSVTDSSN